MQKEMKIPKKAIVVRTVNSVYKFGEADEQGERNVTRDGNPLEFSRCRITFLAIGKGMELLRLDGPEKGKA
jgi:hypothetical protein